jgi:hypothetical protein
VRTACNNAWLFSSKQSKLKPPALYNMSTARPTTIPKAKTAAVKFPHPE